jgi:phage-related protein
MLASRRASSAASGGNRRVANRQRRESRSAQGAQLEMARVLTILAEGRMPNIAKPLTGFGSGVMELALRCRGDAFRVVYALRIGDDIWVVHAFQKKSKTGISTPKPEIALIHKRLKRLKERLR